MNATTVEKSGSFITSQVAGANAGSEAAHPVLTGPAVTISHQTGAGAHETAQLLVKLLDTADRKKGESWTVLDRQIVERALEEHHLPTDLAKKMPEDKRSYLDDVLDDFFGLRPPSWVLVPQVMETMQRLAEAGHVILIGRGAAAVTARMRNVFHVRLVASLATRVGRVQSGRNLSIEEATQFVEKADRGRRRYVRANLHARLEDDLLYHMVLNTDRLTFPDTAALIAEGAARHFRRNPGN